LDVFLHLCPFICLPVWLVVSGSLDVCLHLSPFICLLVTSLYVPPCVSPDVSSGVRLSACLSFLVSLYQCASGARLSRCLS
jgi:hypothetical protein